MKIETKRNFDFVMLKKNFKKPFKNFQTDNLDNVAKQLKENITKGTYFNNPIHEVTKEVRQLRGRTGTEPLVDTGRLLKSIKKTKKGISTKGYGALQHDGYKTKPGHAFYAPHKKAKNKRLIRVGSKTIEPRPWIIYKPKKKELDLFFKDFMKFIRIPMKSIGTKKITI